MSKIPFSQMSEDNKISLIQEMKAIELFFKKIFNLELYLIFGTLLGAIREKDFIPHDYDVDLAYISKFNTLDESIIEFKSLCDILIEKKLFIKSKGFRQIHCASLNRKFKFDIWRSYKNINSQMCLAPINFKIDSNIILPLKSYSFYNTLFNVPNNPEELMNLLYKNWQTPIITDFRKFEMK